MASLDEFTYSPLGPLEIRLIKILPGRDSDLIRCTLENLSWDDNPEYETLSYVWGPDQLYASIILNGRPFLVRRNLWFALYYLRGNRGTKTRTLREDEAIPSAISPENDLVAQVTNIKAKFKSAVSRGKAKLGSSSERSEEMSSLESDMGRISVRQQRLADKSKSSSGRMVWIDAICINQADILERNVQVQMMGMVYEKAKCVLIWLGEDPSNDRAALKYFRDLNELAKQARTPSPKGSGEYVTGLSTDLTTYGENYEINIEDSEQPSEEAKLERLNKVNWDAILEICYRSFWERLWVIQEVVLSQRRLVLYGNDDLPWEYFEHVLQTMVTDKGMASISVWKLSREIHDRLMRSPAIKFFQGLKNIDFTGETGRCSLRSLVTSFHGSMTTDPKDQIYGFLGIAAPAKGVIADYTKTAAKLYIDVLKASIWSSNYTDHYLVHFSELLQRALGEPFWNNDKESFFHIGHDLSIKHGTNQALHVRAILGKRIKWESESHMASLRKALNKMSGEKSELEMMLDKKGFKGGRTFQQITAFDKEANNSVFLQRFRIHKYFRSELTEGGSALLSQIPNPDDYLCFFKDCNIAAVVRLKPGSSNIYVVVGRALVDQSTNFYDWTMECNVELTLQSLQLLTR